jgi:hypothetical protein
LTGPVFGGAFADVMDQQHGHMELPLQFAEITQNRATWNKGAHGVMQQIRDIEQVLPFAIQGFHSDNGKEFLNHHLYRYYV